MGNRPSYLKMVVLLLGVALTFSGLLVAVAASIATIDDEDQLEFWHERPVTSEDLRNDRLVTTGGLLVMVVGGVIWHKASDE